MYSVGEVAAVESQTVWDDAFRALHGSHTVNRPNVASPARQLVWQRTDRFNLAWCGGAQQSFARATKHVRADPRGTFELLVPLRGKAVARIGDSVTELTAGTAALCDSDRPLHFSHGADFAALALVVPQTEIDTRDKHLGGVTSVLDTTKGLGALVRQMATSLHDERVNIDQQAFDASCDGLIDLVCLAAANSAVSPSQHSESVIDTVRKYVRAHAHERDLDVHRIARALGWSTRHIQAVLQGCGTTARDLIREQRLHLARARLTSSGWSDASITDIAYASGFSTHSLFSNAFRAEFGVTPTAVRQAAASNSMDTSATG